MNHRKLFARKAQAVDLMPLLAMKRFYKEPPKRIGLWTTLFLSNVCWIGIACVLWSTTWASTQLGKTITQIYLKERAQWTQIDAQKNQELEKRNMEIARLIAFQTSSPGDVLLLGKKIAKVLDTASGQNRAFLEKALPEAIHIQVQYGIPASAILSQAIYESGYGNSSLAKQYNNFFGIKAFDNWQGAKAQGMPTVDSGVKTTANFRAYKDLGTGFQGYADYLRESGRYDGAFYTKSGEEFVRRILKAGYCPDSNYGDNIRAIMDRHNFQELDSIIQQGANAPYQMAWNNKAPEIPAQDTKTAATVQPTAN